MFLSFLCFSPPHLTCSSPFIAPLHAIPPVPLPSSLLFIPSHPLVSSPRPSPPHPTCSFPILACSTPPHTTRSCPFLVQLSSPVTCPAPFFSVYHFILNLSCSIHFVLLSFVPLRSSPSLTRSSVLPHPAPFVDPFRLFPFSIALRSFPRLAKSFFNFLPSPISVPFLGPFRSLTRSVP